MAVELLQIDSAMEVVDPRDCQQYRGEQQRATTRSDARRQFMNAYAARRASLSADPPAAVVTAPLPEVIPQANAREYMPPIAHIWRANKRQAWNAHIPPRPRISEPFHGSEQMALKIILARSWASYLELQGQSFERCPWNFDEAVSLAAAASSGL